MTKLIKCDQIRCAFLINGGCRACKTCHAEPFLLNENCDTCWNCAHDEGLLRWDDDSNGEDINQKESEEEKEIEQPLMTQ